MERLMVDSSVISAVGYDSETQTLEIKFESGSVYEYYDVPGETYEELMAAESHGQFFNAKIKDIYSYEKIR